MPGRRPGRPRGTRVQHIERARLSANHPVHVTLRVCKGVYNLRSRRSFRWIEKAMRAVRTREDARFVHYSVQGNHIHLIVEASDRVRLARFIQGFEIRVARWLNRMMNGRKGRVFADRYHAHILRTPRETRNAIAYVLRNATRHHGHDPRWADPYSSALTFQGWSTPSRSAWSPISPGEPLTSAPKTWLLRQGWRRRGPLAVERYSTASFAQKSHSAFLTPAVT